MNKKIIALAVALMFSLSVAGMSMAARCKGDVKENASGEMIIKLHGKCKAKAGDSVKIKVKAAAGDDDDAC